MRPILSSFLLSLAAPVLAQTYIVDVNNGHGTSFTSIAAAVAAVPDGAVIVVRPGGYNQFGIGNKSLKVLADPGVVVFNSAITSSATIWITGLQAGKSVVLRGLEVQPPFPTATVMVALGFCAGSVLLDHIQVGFGTGAWLQATNCDQLLLRDTTPGPNSSLVWQLTNCNTVAERSTAFAGFIGSAVVMTGGTLQLAGSSVTAGIPYPTANAVEMHGGDLRVLGNTTLQAIAVSSSFIVGGNGTARYDTSATIAAPGFAPTITAMPLVMPTVSTTFAAGQATATVTSAPGQLVAVAVALPGPLVVLPGLDPIWLDGATFTPLALGVFTTPSFAVQLPWTSGPVQAVRAVFQALTFDPATGFAISNPSLLLLP